MTTTTTRQIWWDRGGNTPAWPCGWCWGECERDDDGKIIESNSGPLAGTDSGDPTELHAYTDEELRALAQAQFPSKTWADVEIDPDPKQ